MKGRRSGGGWTVRLGGLCLLTLGTLCSVESQPLHAQAPLSGERVLVVRDATVLVGNTLEPTPNTTVVIRNGRITEIAPDADVTAPPGSEVVDATGGYVLPGLIDSHVHLGTVPNRRQAESEAKRLLLAGITSVRDMAGDARFLGDLARAASIDEIVSPRIYYSALVAGPTFFKDPRPQASAQGAVAGEVAWLQGITPSTDLQVAMALAKGTSATGIKIYGNLDGLAVWRISREAHRFGMQVWAHSAVFPARPLEVVKGGVDVVSHACRLAWEAWNEVPAEYHHGQSPTAEGFDIDHPVLGTLFGEMLRRGTILDATLALYARTERMAQENPDRAPPVRCEPGVAQTLVKRAHAAGIPIAAGTDFTTPEGAAPALFQELEELHEQAGLSIVEALRSATVVGAQALGIEADYGTIAEGKVADLLILDADPTAELGNLERVLYVVKGGRVVRDR